MSTANRMVLKFSFVDEDGNKFVLASVFVICVLLCVLYDNFEKLWTLDIYVVASVEVFSVCLLYKEGYHSVA